MSEADVAAADEAVLYFPDGIPGFPGARRFVVSDLAEGGDGAFQLLSSPDDPALSLVVTVPWLFFPDYALDLDEADRRELELDRAEDAIVFCAVTTDAARDEAYVNLLGPFVVNARTRTGRQVVLADEALALRAPLPLAG